MYEFFEAEHDYSQKGATCFPLKCYGFASRALLHHSITAAIRASLPGVVLHIKA